MQLSIIFPLPGKRRICHVEINARTGKSESEAERDERGLTHTIVTPPET